MKAAPFKDRRRGYKRTDGLSFRGVERRRMRNAGSLQVEMDDFFKKLKGVAKGKKKK